MPQESQEQPNILEDVEFQFFLKKAHATRELWWVPYEVVADMCEKEISAFRIIAKQFEVRHYEMLSLIYGDEIMVALQKGEQDKGETLARIVNTIYLRSYKESMKDASL
jgi:hypothetical protein